MIFGASRTFPLGDGVFKSDETLSSLFEELRTESIWISRKHREGHKHAHDFRFNILVNPVGGIFVGKEVTGSLLDIRQTRQLFCTGNTCFVRQEKTCHVASRTLPECAVALPGADFDDFMHRVMVLRQIRSNVPWTIRENDVFGFKSGALTRDAFGYCLSTRLNFVEVFGHGVLPATDLGGDY